MNAPKFISEDDLGTFEGWLEYQAIDPASLPPEQLAVWQRLYDESRARVAAQPKIGSMKLRPLVSGEYRYAVAVREGAGLWLTLWVRRSPKGEYFVMVPRGTEGWDPHTSYHRDGTMHAKSYGQKFPSISRRQPLTAAFKGAEPLGAYAGHAPKSEGAVCDAPLFTGVIEIPLGWLGPRHGSVTVDLVEPGQEPREHPWAEIYQREVFKDAVPWLVITVGRNAGEPAPEAVLPQ